MVRPIRTTVVLTLVYLCLVSMASAQQDDQGYTEQDFERIAASILRRQASSKTATRSDSQTKLATEPPTFDAPAFSAELEESSAGGNSKPLPSYLAPAPTSHSTTTIPSALYDGEEEQHVAVPEAPEDAFVGTSTPVGTSVVEGTVLADGAACDCEQCRMQGSTVGLLNKSELDCNRSFSVRLGVYTFKNMLNRDDSGSFGFHEGFSWASDWVFTPLGMQAQLGFRASQSDFDNTDFTNDSRNQYFVTGGFFHRAHRGWQGGVVLDYLHEDWYTTLDLGQLRGELSYAVPNGSSIGFWFATSVVDDDATSDLLSGSVLEEWESHDMYSVFWNLQANHWYPGQWRVWAGFTGAGDGLIGTDMRVPLKGNWSLEPEFTWLFPDEETGVGGLDSQSYSGGINLVWYPGRPMARLNYFDLPLLDVAGNGTMITRRRQ